MKLQRVYHPKVSAKAFHEEMNIPMAEDGDDVLQSTEPQAPGANFIAAKCQDCGTTHEFSEPNAIAASQFLDDAIEKEILVPALSMLKSYEKQGKDLNEFLADLPEFFVSLNTDDIDKLSGQIMRYAMAEGIEAESNA